jgi:hypothetical protein
MNATQRHRDAEKTAEQSLFGRDRREKINLVILMLGQIFLKSPLNRVDALRPSLCLCVSA